MGGAPCRRAIIVEAWCAALNLRLSKGKWKGNGREYVYVTQYCRCVILFDTHLDFIVLRIETRVFRDRGVANRTGCER